ncbi:hypothetical protein [Actinoplanes sp. L3-i22]|uniref:hypothetical protein n=1 Tax=Actinoplanes sp. L3-i22 TaxID=2836373 RepID=UPI001C74D600|nr:hypothetical protein [Actinoplanes sp. L3-i22]BCY11127.1 hypothetical protein L3i22_062150 [Actinoplanes sp. L3-i22]
MGLTDSIRIMLGKLTPAEIEERDAAARARRAKMQAAEKQDADRRAAEAAAAQAENAARRREADLFKQRLSRAAGIAILELHCHRDTWQWIQDWMSVGLGGGRSWWSSAFDDRITQQTDHMLVVQLSGPQTAEILTRVARIGRIHGASTGFGSTANDTDRAIGRRLYQAIGRILDQIAPDTTSKQAVPPVVLDDRPEHRND